MHIAQIIREQHAGHATVLRGRGEGARGEGRKRKRKAEEEDTSAREERKEKEKNEVARRGGVELKSALRSHFRMR